MTASSKADAGVFTPARLTRVVTGPAVTAVLAVVFGLSVLGEVPNTPHLAPSVDTPVPAAATPALACARARPTTGPQPASRTAPPPLAPSPPSPPVPLPPPPASPRHPLSPPLPDALPLSRRVA